MVLEQTTDNHNNVFISFGKPEQMIMMNMMNSDFQ